MVDHYFVVSRPQENVGIWLALFHMVLAVLNQNNQESIQELHIIKIGFAKQLNPVSILVTIKNTKLTWNALQMCIAIMVGDFTEKTSIFFKIMIFFNLGKCVQKSHLCNLYSDCFDGADEKHCKVVNQYDGM